MTSGTHEGQLLPHEAYLTALASLEQVGPATFRWLLSHGSPRRVWQRVCSGALSPGPGARVDKAQIQRWRDQSRKLDPQRLWRRCLELDVGVVSLGSAAYPSALADDPDPPVILFQRGDPSRTVGPKVAIVGTRRATRYGVETARSLGQALTEAGVSVVSGLATGIDVAAHEGALDALASEDGRSLTGDTYPSDGPGDSTSNSRPGPIAVVGASLENPCPRSNLSIARRVASSGVLYSEVPPGTPSAPWRFPVRNRILAAMSDVVVVVESPAAGGSMHTVREALDRDRNVMSVPGPINCISSEGTNQLIRDGAAPCLGAADVLMALGMVSSTTPCDGNNGAAAPGSGMRDQRPQPSGDAATVLDSLGWRPVSIESLASSCNLSPRQLARATAELESSGWITRTGSWVERRNQG